MAIELAEAKVQEAQMTKSSRIVVQTVFMAHSSSKGRHGSTETVKGLRGFRCINSGSDSDRRPSHKLTPLRVGRLDRSEDTLVLHQNPW